MLFALAIVLSLKINAVINIKRKELIVKDAL